MESWREELFHEIVRCRSELKDAYDLDVIVEKELYEEAMAYLRKTERLKR